MMLRCRKRVKHEGKWRCDRWWSWWWCSKRPTQPDVDGRGWKYCCQRSTLLSTLIMGVSTSASFGLAILCSVLVFSALQVYKAQLGSTRLMTLVAGYVASWLFIFMLTGLNNLENIIFGKGFQARVIPEVVLCLVLACSAAGMVHRVSVTVCFLCSLMGLFYLNKMSQNSFPVSSISVGSKKKK